MKTHRPWQPHMSHTPLFNPYTPATGKSTLLDHFDLIEEDQSETADEQAEDQAGDSPSVRHKD